MHRPLRGVWRHYLSDWKEDGSGVRALQSRVLNDVCLSYTLHRQVHTPHSPGTPFTPIPLEPGPSPAYRANHRCRACEAFVSFASSLLFFVLQTENLPLILQAERTWVLSPVQMWLDVRNWEKEEGSQGEKKKSKAKSMSTSPGAESNKLH